MSKNTSAKYKIQRSTQTSYHYFYSKEYYAGIIAALSNDDESLSNKISQIFKMLFSREDTAKNKKYKSLLKSKSFIKINADIEYLPDTAFVNITKSLRTIAENFCELLDVSTENLEIYVLSATPGCFNINFGINVNNCEFNLLKLQKDPDKYKLIEYIIETLTGNSIESYNDFIELLKDSITGYITKKIPEEDQKIKYIDMKKTKESKKLIFKTIKELPDLESVSFNKQLIMAEEIDMIV